MSLLEDLKAQVAAKGMTPAPAPLSLKDQLKKAAYDKRVAEQREADRVRYDPTRDMSGLQKTLAGIGSGMMGVAQGVGNIVGLVDDETIAERKQIDQNLMQTGHGKAGQFIGETAALLPTALATGGSSLVGHAGARAATAAPRLAKAVSPALARGGTVAATEGALGGGILADPGSRTQGALVGAGTGLVLNKAMQGAGRVFKDGLVKVSPQATALKKAIKQKVGKEPFIPLAQAADSAGGATSAVGAKAAQVAGMFPAARAKMEAQSGDLANDYYETLIKDVFKNKASADAGVKELREGSGNLINVFDAALDAAPKPKTGIIKFNKPQQRIYDAIKREGGEGRVDPEAVSKALTKDLASHASRYKTATDARLAGQVLGKPISFSDMASRQMFHGLVRRAGPTALSPNVGSFLGSEGVQNFIMGSAKWQQQLREAVEDPTGQLLRDLMSDVRRAMSAQAGQNSTQTIDQTKSFMGV